MPEEILWRVSEVESRLDPLALYNNTRRISVHPASRASSVERARRWLARGDSVDIGLMQINSGNLAALGMTVEAALDACRSLKAGARILSSAYAQSSSSVDRQAALLIALSRYNTGNTLAGLANGYAGQVLALQADATKSNSKSSVPTSAKPRDWDIWSAAFSAQHGGAPWLIGSQDTHDFLIGAGAQPEAGEPHAMSSGPGTAPGM